jgi:hypothetical protein
MSHQAMGRDFHTERAHTKKSKNLAAKLLTWESVMTYKAFIDGGAVARQRLRSCLRLFGD